MFFVARVEIASFKEKPQTYTVQHFFFKPPEEFELTKKPSVGDKQNLVKRKNQKNSYNPIHPTTPPCIGKTAPVHSDPRQKRLCYIHSGRPCY